MRTAVTCMWWSSEGGDGAGEWRWDRHPTRKPPDFENCARLCCRPSSLPVIPRLLTPHSITSLSAFTVLAFLSSLPTPQPRYIAPPFPSSSPSLSPSPPPLSPWASTDGRVASRWWHEVARPAVGRLTCGSPHWTRPLSSPSLVPLFSSPSPPYPSPPPPSALPPQCAC